MVAYKEEKKKKKLFKGELLKFLMLGTSLTNSIRRSGSKSQAVKVLKVFPVIAMFRQG